MEKVLTKNLLPNGGAKWWCFPWKITLNISKNPLLNITKNQWITLPWKWCAENHPQKGHSSQSLNKSNTFLLRPFWVSCWVVRMLLDCQGWIGSYISAKWIFLKQGVNSFWRLFSSFKKYSPFGMMHSFSSETFCKCSQTKLTNTPTDSHQGKPFWMHSKSPNKKNTHTHRHTTVFTQQKKSTQLTAQTWCVVSSSENLAANNFFNSQFFHTSLFWWQKLADGEQQKTSKSTPQQHNSTFSFCKVAMLLRLFTPTTYLFGARIFDEKTPRVCGFPTCSKMWAKARESPLHRRNLAMWKVKTQQSMGLLVVGCYAVGSWWLVVVACWSFRVKPTWDFFEKHSLFLFEWTFWKSSSPKKGVDLTMEYSAGNQSTFSKSKTSNQIIHLDPPLWAGFWKKTNPILPETNEACLPLKIDAWKTKSCFPLLGCHIIKG